MAGTSWLINLVPLGLKDLTEYLQTNKYLMLLPHHIRRPDVTDTGSGQVEKYTGVMGTTFKERYNGHKSDIRHRKDIHTTCLANHIWNMKDGGKNVKIQSN